MDAEYTRSTAAGLVDCWLSVNSYGRFVAPIHSSLSALRTGEQHSVPVPLEHMSALASVVSRDVLFEHNLSFRRSVGSALTVQST